MNRNRRLVAAALAGVLSLTAAACSDDSEDDATTTEEGAGTDDTGTGMEGSTDGASETMPATVVDVATGSDDFSTLVTAVQAAGLVDDLSGDGPFTVFAPTNAAFEALPDDTLDSLLAPEAADTLTAVLTYHVVPSKAMSGDLTDGMTVTTLQGEDLTIGVSDDGVTVTDAAGNTVNVAAADVEAGNGVVHVIDGVLLPSVAAG